MTQTKETDSNEKEGQAGSPAPAEAAPVTGAGAADLEAAKKEAAANFDRYMRAVADLENFRKRALREKEDLRQFAAVGLIEDLIPVLDNLGLAIAAAQQQTDTKGIVDGVTMVQDQIKGALAKHGIVEIDPANQPFDPHLHDCISHQPSDTVAAEAVMHVVRRGYSLNGRLIRPATVVVSSGPAQPEATKS